MARAHKFWCVWNPARGVPTVRHTSLAGAMEEAERLTAQAPGGSEFFVLEAIHVMRLGPIETSELAPFDPTDMPF